MVDNNEEEEIPDVCKITPVSAYLSTNLNNKIKSYEDISTRILNILGWPTVSVNIHIDQINEAISMACELYTRYAGYTKDYMVFDSNLYEKNKGIRLDYLYTISSLDQARERNSSTRVLDKGQDQTLSIAKDVYVTKKYIDKEDYYITDAEFKEYQKLPDFNNSKFGDIICARKDASFKWQNGIEEFSIITGLLYEYLILDLEGKYTKDDFKKSKDAVVTQGGEKLDIYKEDENLGNIRTDKKFQGSFDYDLMDYRKVISVREYSEGSSTTMTSLFSFEAALASQTYFTYQFSLRGFDMVSWYTMHEWRKTREKMLATKRDWKFNEYTQYFTLNPQPRENTRFYSVIECYIERPLKDIIKSPWVYQYALAVVKEMIGNISGRYGTVALPGGGQISGETIKQEGLSEQDKLRTLLTQKNGYGEAQFPGFYLG